MQCTSKHAAKHKTAKATSKQLQRSAIYDATGVKLTKAQKAALPAHTICYYCSELKQWCLQPCTCRTAPWNNLFKQLHIQVRRIKNRDAVEVICSIPSWRTVLTVTDYNTIQFDANAYGKFANEHRNQQHFMNANSVMQFKSTKEVRTYIKHLLTNPDYPGTYERLQKDLLDNTRKVQCTCTVV